MRVAVFISLVIGLAALFVRAQGSHDGAIVAAMRQTDRDVAAVKIWRRVSLNADLDLVLAMGGENEGQLLVNRGGSALWYPKLGLLLQERANAGRVYTLTIAPGTACGAHILRATITDTVISCEQEKGEVEPSQKFVYDIRAKRLVSRVEYMPFGHVRITPTGADRARLVTASDAREVTIEFLANGTPEFRIVGTKAIPADDHQRQFRQRSGPALRYPSRPFGPANAFTLVAVEGAPECPDGDTVIIERRGQRRLRHRLPPAECDYIGPWAIEGSRLWFGKTFYSGEGYDGTGGFGYFDASTRQFELFALPADSTPSAATAILVQPDATWLALALHGEYASIGRGLVRYDRQSRTTMRFDIGESIGYSFVAFRDRIAVALEDGFVFVRNGQVKGYIVDQTTDGRLRVAEAFN
jgi:hypothetical protein